MITYVWGVCICMYTSINMNEELDVSLCLVCGMHGHVGIYNVLCLWICLHMSLRVCVCVCVA
jgi:hypothetical protein